MARVSGGTSQDRRRERRAAERKNSLVAASVAEPAAAAVEDPLLAEIAAFADAPMSGECAECGHMADDHAGEMMDGACGMEGCSCEGFEAKSMTAAAPLPWNDEMGLMDVMEDIRCLLNPDDSYRWDVVDVAIGGDSAILCDSDTYCYYLVPLTYGDDWEPVLPPQSEWTEVESEWVAAASQNGLQRLEAARALKDSVEPLAEPVMVGQTFTFSIPNAAVAGSNTVTFTTSNGTAEVVPFAAVELPAEHQPRDEVPAAGEITPPAETASESAAGGIKWQAMIAPEGKLTDDGRAFAPGSIGWRDLPLSLGSMLDTPHADVVMNSEVCGRIDNIWRDGNVLRAEGVFDSGDRGTDIARMVGDGTLRGVSVDLAVHSFEVGPRTEFFDEEGNWAPQETPEDDGGEGSLLDLLFGGEDSVFVVTDGTIGAVTVCPFPAFADATIDIASSMTAGANPAVWTVTSQAGWTVSVPMTISLVASGDNEDAPEEQPQVLTASAAGLVPEAPPAEWFDYPGFDGLTALTVDDDGRVYGHAAAWDTCHIGVPGVCTTPPTTDTGYAYFHLKEVMCDDGSRVSCGTITLDTGHAERNLSRAAAARHYDHTGTAVADVVTGEDEWGIWFAGSLRPDVDEVAARKLRGASLSGDWRNVNGNLELVALLAVNVPGFPVPRGPVAALVASGEVMEMQTLIAAGIHVGQETVSRLQAAQMQALADDASGEYDEFKA